MIAGISEKVLADFKTYHWPGNIRELENVIERSVLLTRGTIIDQVSLPGNQQNTIPAMAGNSGMKTIHENERDYIIKVLQKCNGKIWGTNGAAQILNIPASTLRSKMKKLGIHKESIE